MSPSPSPGKVRTTAAAWRERETSCSRDRDRTQSPAVPTRRIGSLFNRDPDYWNLNLDNTEELPHPPQSPPAPARQSSRGKMEEYSRDWRLC